MSSVKIFPTSSSSATSSSSSSTASTSTSSTAALSSRWIQLRLARRTDVPSLQRCNLATLPENYNSQFYLNHLRTWPDLALVCEALPLNYNDADVPPPSNNNGSNKLTALWGGASRPFQPEPNIVAYVLGKIEEDEDEFECDDDQPPVDNSDNNDAADVEWIDNDDAYFSSWSRSSLLRFRNSNPSHRSLSSSSSSSSSLWSRREEEDLIHELSSSTRQRAAAPMPPSPSPSRRRRRHRLRGHVTSLAVMPEYRRLGLAAALMKQLHHHLTTTTSFTLEQPLQYDDCGWDTTRVYQNNNKNKLGNEMDKQNQKITRVGLHVRKSNMAACTLYQRDGYEVTRVISNYYQDGEDAFYMTKALAVEEEALTSRTVNPPSKAATSKVARKTLSSDPSPQQHQQRLWGGKGSQRWRVSHPQERKEQQKAPAQQRQVEQQPTAAASKSDELELPRFIDLEVERQAYLRSKEAATRSGSKSSSAAAATTGSNTRTSNGNSKSSIDHHQDHDEEPELLTGTM